MALIFPKFPRDLGAPVNFTWSAATYRDPGMTTGRAAIFGWSNAQFSSVVGGESFDVTVDGGAPATVTLQAGDVTDVAVISRINTDVGATVAIAAYLGGIVLYADDSIAVSNYGSYPTDFKRVGLPIMSRAHNSTTTEHVLGPSSCFEVSDPITVPEAATEADIRIRVFGNDSLLKSHAGFLPVWSTDGGDSDITSLATTLDGFQTLLISDYVLAGRAEVEQSLNYIEGVTDFSGNPVQYQFVGTSALLSPLSGSDIFPHTAIHNFKVPAGRRKLRLMTFHTPQLGTSGPGSGNPPILHASVAFSAR